MTLFSLALTVGAACLFTEFVGYFLHILLHSEKVAWLSRNHMIHHLKVYGPRKALRQAGPYKDSTYGRAAVGGIGFEWLLPISLILAGALAGLHRLGVPPGLQAVFTTVALAWGKFVFGTMHDSMHIEDHWMAQSKLLGPWFRQVRRLHDIHHLEFSDEGRMTYNFGICFFLFDRLLGSRLSKARAFNEKGYQAALKRYAAVIG